MAVEIYDDDDNPASKLIISVYPDNDGGYLGVYNLSLKELRDNPDTCDVGEIIAMRDMLPVIDKELDNLIDLLTKYREEDAE